ncbi:hypothetical protein [Streptomyces sp. NPDC093225]|uniref:hypothetical protein n=1 Tax=Streptomyces sp. NPDC093225 TaxID=3366034 RepID=UPI003801CCC2
MRRKILGAAVAVVLGAGLLTACASAGGDELRYAGDYAGHRPLAVVGFPSAGSLQVVQEVVWALGEGDAERLAAVATDDGDADAVGKTAANWIAAFGKGARGKVTAEFYDEGSERQVVVLYFHDTGRTKDLVVRVTNDGGPAWGWRVRLNEPDPAEAAAAPTWAPKEPGAHGSLSVP